jgi:hypothetical protein
LHSGPDAAARSCDTASIERPRNAAMGCNTGQLNFTNNWRDVFGEAISSSFQIGDSAITNISKPWIAEHNTASLGGLQCVLCALGNHLAFMLRDGGQDVNRELVGVRVVHRDELDTGVNLPL